MNHKIDRDTYIIPPNFIESGTFFGGMFKARNVIEAGILAFAIGVPVFSLLPLGLTARIIALCLTALPAALVALIGISGESLSSFLLIFIKYLRNRRIVGGNSAEDAVPAAEHGGKHIKKKVHKPDKAPRRSRRSGREDFPAEFDEVRGYEIRQKLRPVKKQKPAKEKKASKQKKKVSKERKVKRPIRTQEPKPACLTDGDVTVTGGGSNIAQIIEGPRIFMAENKFKEIYETPTLYGFLFDVEEQYQQEMETYLAQDTDVAYTSILTMKATVSGVKNVVLLIGGMIGAVFALVGLINFINLVMTNIITRRHEFATMQSIGMTNRQLRKMMISESFSYVLLAGIVGTLAAAVLGITLVRSFVEISPSSIMMTFQMTLLPALIMLILFLALAFIVPVVALRLFNNRSVVERLRVNE